MTKNKERFDKDAEYTLNIVQNGVFEDGAGFYLAALLNLISEKTTEHMDIGYLLGSVPSNSTFDHPKRVVEVCCFVVVEHFQVNHTDSSNVNLKGCRLSSAIVVNSAQPRNRDHQTSFKLLTPQKYAYLISLC